MYVLNFYNEGKEGQDSKSEQTMFQIICNVMCMFYFSQPMKWATAKLLNKNGFSFRD